MNDKLNDALSEVKEEYIAEAAAHKRRPYWLGAVAAVLAAAVLISIIGGTGAPPAPTDPALERSAGERAAPPLGRTGRTGAERKEATGRRPARPNEH